jgi:hypothetical protein
MDQIESDYGDKGDAKNREIAESTAWKSSATSIAIGAGVGLIAVPTMGAGAIAVPIAIGVAEGTANTYFGNMFEADAEEQAKEAEDERNKEKRMDENQFEDAGLTASQLPLNRYILNNGVSQEDSGEMVSGVQNAYMFGRQY